MDVDGGGAFLFPCSSVRSDPDRVSLSYRTFTGTLEPVSRYRVRVLASFHEK